MIKSIDSKLISVYLNNDYSLIADLHIFVYTRAECTKVKLLILNNFEPSFFIFSCDMMKLKTLGQGDIFISMKKYLLR